MSDSSRRSQIEWGCLCVCGTRKPDTEFFQAILELFLLQYARFNIFIMDRYPKWHFWYYSSLDDFDITLFHSSFPFYIPSFVVRFLDYVNTSTTL
jgi:hypothetical protein